MVKGIRAFSNPKYDYYELTQDLCGILPKGAVFVHDTDDDVNGSPAEGCLKLCWTPDGNIYSGKIGGISGGTVILHAMFRKTDLFQKVAKKVKHTFEFETDDDWVPCDHACWTDCPFRFMIRIGNRCKCFDEEITCPFTKMQK